MFPGQQTARFTFRTQVSITRRFTGCFVSITCTTGDCELTFENFQDFDSNFRHSKFFMIVNAFFDRFQLNWRCSSCANWISNFHYDRRNQESRSQAPFTAVQALLQCQHRKVAHRNDFHHQPWRSRKAERENSRLVKDKHETHSNVALFYLLTHRRLCRYIVLIEKLKVCLFDWQRARRDCSISRLISSSVR